MADRELGWVWLVCFLLYVSSPGYSQSPINTTVVELWAQKLGEKLNNISVTYSGITVLKQTYDDALADGKFEVLQKNGTEMIDRISKNMESMLDNKVKAVENLVEAAEKANVAMDRDLTIDADEVTYFNAMLINDWNNDTQTYETHDGLGGEFKLEPDEHFNDIAVNVSESTVQVPTNVYNREETVLRDILFTEELDRVFESNYNNDPTLTWQYFGSYTGFFRNYPGIKWSPDEQKSLDLYDCRNRGWYIRAATSPKNMVILVDTSGSMLGLRNDIAKHTVQTLIHTLGDDDFFNVITFNDSTLYLEDCFNDTLVQANSDNKNLVRQNLDNINPKNIADIAGALEKAFQLLEKFNTTNRGAGCNEAIMLITDGATEDYASLFAKYNPDKHVRLFTYVIGREVDYSEKVRVMACQNKGYFTQIKTIADVQENVSKYIHVLSRPMVIKQVHDTVWTNVYMDQAHPVNRTALKRMLEKEGLALMTTVAQPVFDKRNQTLDQGILLGVVGVDVPVFELLKLTPPYMLGVNGYSFAVTNNGYLLFHPDLRPLYGPDNSLKTNYNSVDLAEVELSDEEDEYDTNANSTFHYSTHEGSNHTLVAEATSVGGLVTGLSTPAIEPTALSDHIEIYRTRYSDEADYEMQLRTAMVNRTTGSLTMEVKLHLSNLKRATTRSHSYYYTDLEKTPFSLGIVLVNEYGQYYIKPDVNLEEGLEKITKGNVTLPNGGPWIYCRLTNEESKRMTKLQKIMQLINTTLEDGETTLDPDNSICDIELIKLVLLDAMMTLDVSEYWETLLSNPNPAENISPFPHSVALANITTYEVSEIVSSWNKSAYELISQVASSPDDAKALVSKLHRSQNDSYDELLTLLLSRTSNASKDTAYGIVDTEAGGSSDSDTTNQPIGPGNGIVLQFVGTNGGLTRSSWNSMSATATDFVEENSNTLQEDYYTRAVELGEDKFLYSVPIVLSDAEEQNETLVTASSVVMAGNAVAAVAGIQFKSAYLREIFEEVTESCPEGVCRNCSDELIDCYLLDNSGYIVFSENPTEVGKPLTRIDSGAFLMAELSREPRNVFKRIIITDFQGMCQDADPGGSMASRLLDPFFSVTAYIKWWTHYFVLSLLQFSFYDWWYAAAATVQPVAYKHTFSDNPCDRVYTFFDHKAGQQSGSKHSSAMGEPYCEKFYSVEAVPNSNLLLLVVDATCEGALNDTIFEPVKKDYNSTEKCERLQKQRHRTRPETCHAYHPEENADDCGSGHNIRPSVVLTLTVALYVALKHLQIFQIQ